MAKQTALYTELDRAYSEALSGPYQDLSSDMSIAALSGGVITGYWRPVIIFDNHIEEVRRLWDISRDIQYLDYLHDGELDYASKWLLTHGHVAIPFYTHIIDLHVNQWRDVRKSYQNLINQSEPHKLVTDIMQYKKLHEELSGRRTRPAQTWKIQQKMIDAEEAFILMYEDDSGGAMFMVDGDWAYYASAKCRGNSHGLVWAGLKECERRGVRYVEMGEQVLFGDSKQVNISNFKRGFGGHTYTRLLCRRT